jgi:hypothetical protein
MRIGSIGLMGLSLPHFFGWQQQAKAAGASAARLAGGRGFGSAKSVVNQPLIAVGLLERVEVAPLHVLHNREFERLAVGDGVDEHRHLVEADRLRRAPAPFAGDDLVGVGLVGDGADQDRLHDPLLAHR